MTYKFIDISEHNIINNYSALIDSELKGVIIKATEGTTFIDRMLSGHYENLNGKMPLGFYHYLTVSSEPKTQALNFWNQIKDKNFQIYPVLDVEQTQLEDKAESYSNQFVSYFKEISGQDMIIYSGRCYIDEHFSNEFKSNNTFWVADYGANDKPFIEDCNIIAWQYTEDCKNYPFVFGEVDCNIIYEEEKFFIANEIPFSDIEEDKSYIDVKSLQVELNKQCYTDRNWNELIEDGIPGELTLSACPMLQIGVIGELSRWLQHRLGINEDGVFGSDTRQAVLEFQENNSLDGDGIVGKNTWRKLIGM